MLSAPALGANLVEIPIGLLSDSPRRRRLVLAGGVLFTAALVAVSLAPAFGFLLAALALLYPASGALVALSQADLMDADTTRREQNMARWNLAGSLGALAGPGLLIAAVLAGSGWRGAYAAMAVTAAIALGALALTAASPQSAVAQAAGLRAAVRAALRSLARGDVLRNLLLLEVSDLMLDVLTGYLALYFVDVLGESAWVGALVVAVRIASGLAGDVATVHILERVAGLAYVRATAAATLVAYPLFLLLPGVGVSIASRAERSAARDRKRVPDRGHAHPLIDRPGRRTVRPRRGAVGLRCQPAAADGPFDSAPRSSDDVVAHRDDVHGPGLNSSPIPRVFPSPATIASFTRPGSRAGSNRARG